MHVVYFQFSLKYLFDLLLTTKMEIDDMRVERERERERVKRWIEKGRENLLRQDLCHFPFQLLIVNECLLQL